MIEPVEMVVIGPRANRRANKEGMLVGGQMFHEYDVDSGLRLISPEFLAQHGVEATDWFAEKQADIFSDQFRGINSLTHIDRTSSQIPRNEEEAHKLGFAIESWLETPRYRIPATFRRIGEKRYSNPELVAKQILDDATGQSRPHIFTREYNPWAHLRFAIWNIDLVEGVVGRNWQSIEDAFDQVQTTVRSDRISRLITTYIQRLRERFELDTRDVRPNVVAPYSGIIRVRPT